MDLNKTTERPLHFYSCDMIRIIATFLVVLYHMNAELVTAGCASPLIMTMFGRNMTIGQAGTSLFFVISGYVQSISWEKSDGQELKTRCVTYYKKRWLSIYPVYYLAYIFGHMISPLHFSATGISHHLIWTMLGMDGYVSFLGIPTSYITGEWFLGIIIIMYLLFPFLYAAVRRRPLITAAVLAVLFVVSVSLIPAWILPDLNLFIRLPEFALGIFFYLYRDKLSRAARLIGGAVLCACALFLPLSGMMMYDVLGMGAGLFMILSALGEGLDRRSGNAQTKTGKRLFAFLISAAKLSYPVILMHHILIKTSLEGRQQLDMGYRGYILWSIYILALTIAAAFILYCAGNVLLSFLTSLKLKKNNSDVKTSA